MSVRIGVERQVEYTLHALKELIKQTGSNRIYHKEISAFLSNKDEYWVSVSEHRMIPVTVDMISEGLKKLQDEGMLQSRQDDQGSFVDVMPSLKERLAREAKPKKQALITSYLKVKALEDAANRLRIAIESGGSRGRFDSDQRVKQYNDFLRQADAETNSSFGSDIKILEEEQYPYLIGFVVWKDREIIERLSTLASQLGVLKGTEFSEPQNIYQKMELHARLRAVADNPFLTGNYRGAVLDAAIEYVSFVRERSGELDKDGEGLMSYVFSCKNPKIPINKMKTQTDEDEQKGFMYLSMGAVDLIRNPNAHLVKKDDPMTALNYIAFLSLLFERVDKATSGGLNS